MIRRESSRGNDGGCLKHRRTRLTAHFMRALPPALTFCLSLTWLQGKEWLSHKRSGGVPALAPMA